jgi:ribonuclease H2 subunit C
MQGLKIELPSGYSGVILAGEGAAGKSKTPAIKAKIKRVNKPKSKGRATRSATRADDDEDMDGEGDVHEDDDSRKTRTLIPTAQFSSFVLWHPDIPVDAGRDEYLRSLTEWIRLSDEVSFSSVNLLRRDSEVETDSSL